MFAIILLIGHMIADFFLQSSKMAENKKTNIKMLLYHSSVYLFVLAAINLIFVKLQFAIWTILIIAGSHFIIDFIRTKIDNKIENRKITFITFIIDQILHVVVIIATYFSLNLATNVNFIYRKCECFDDFNKIIVYCFLFVLLLDPSAVFIKKTFSFLFGNDTNNDVGNNIGSVIGKLERIITALLLLYNQYGVIGLVLTAKSIARFKQLEDKNFAERYLVGTLLSIFTSLLSTQLIKYFLTL